ncbi:MAG TPA: SigE family RNA polymerase sigma factor [Nocardioides sp.]|nr:SigE family RNA polymerase sigma factor [Nocardioides sp.]
MEHSFEAFVAADGARLGRLCHQLTGSHDDALDLAQDVLTRVWQRWSRVAAAEHPYAYVRRIAVNMHLNSIRKRRPTPSDVEPVDRAVDPDLDRRPDDELWHALHRLPARQRAALVLRYYEDLPDEETAAVLGCRRATVRSLVARGLETLRTFELDGSRT